MRIRTPVIWAFWLAVLAYAVYTGASAAYNHASMAELVQDNIEKTTKTPLAGSESDRVNAIRADLLRAAHREGFPLDDRKVTVFQAGSTIHVIVKWSYPVITVAGENVLAIPLKLDRAYPMR